MIYRKLGKSGLDASVIALGAWIMEALAVLTKIGLFQINGGTEANPVYEIGRPAFDKVIIWLNQDYYQGESFTIKTIRLNEENLSRFKIYHADIVKGGELILEMSNENIISSKN